MKKNLIVLIIILIAGFGCATTKKDPLAPELAKKAMDDFEKQRYSSAIETFDKLLDWYPFDKLATLAEFKIAEAHFNMKEYGEAIIFYKDFIKLHPRNDAVPYLMYQIAQAYYKRIDSVDRDQNNARFALASFRDLIQQFSDSDYAKKSEPLVNHCLRSIAGHDVYVGAFYYKSKHYKAALIRFQEILVHYPGLGYDIKANEYIKLCNEKIKIEKVKETKTES